MKNIIGIIFILSCLSIMNCEEGGNSVIGSKDHDIKSATATEPAILANGIATTLIAVNVQNKKDKTSASGMKVQFKTTLGSIEQYGVTNNSGNADVVLTSAASEIDLTAEITATVVDTNFTPLNKPMENHYAISISTPDFLLQKNENYSLAKAEQQLDNKATIYVKFLGVTFQAEIDETILPADGLSKAKINVKLRETTSQKAIKNAELQAFVNYGLIDGGTNTDDRGLAEFYLVADDQPGKDTLSVEYGNKLSRQFAVNYLIPNLTLTPKALQIPADGESTVAIVANLVSYKNTPIPGAEIRFSTSAGIIPELATTDNNGNAIVNLISGKTPNTNVIVIARFHNLKDTAMVSFVASSGVVPSSILLSADPNFIWVKETGNIDQTIISATVLGINNQPLGNDIGVRFHILNNPGEVNIEPSSGVAMISNVIPTVNGIAQATLRSGRKSGTVQIKAEIANRPEIFSQTTNIVIRSGPPYMWVDLNNANNVIHHVTLAVEPGKHNVCFGNPIQDIGITVYFGDKYNNPVEDGTAVYFTTTGGIITSDAITCEKGQASVILQNVNPFPYLVSNDTSQLTFLNICNPNNRSLLLDIDPLNITDFEGSEVRNTNNDYLHNDGIAVILAYTWGRNQDDKPIKVWTTGLVVYSVGIMKFTAEANKTSLSPGEVATIIIRVYDYNGNPVAAGSSLTVSTTAGELSDTNLMPGADKYGYGTTFFSVQLLNNLKPEEDEATTAMVKINLDSPNGTGKRSIPIALKITP